MLIFWSSFWPFKLALNPEKTNGVERFSRGQQDFHLIFTSPVNVSEFLATPHYIISMLWPDPTSVGVTFQELTQSKNRETFSPIGIMKVFLGI